MGGYGSGRPSYKQMAEHCHSLDINRLYRDGCLRPGSQPVIIWIWPRLKKSFGHIGKQQANQHSKRVSVRLSWASQRKNTVG